MFTIILLLFGACRQVSTWAFLYSEMECIGGSCYPQDSCALPRKEEDDHLWNDYTCECGAHCIRSRTCCVDSPHISDALYFKSEGETCQKLSSMSDAVMAVTSCPKQWRDGFIRDKCEKSQMKIEDPLETVPVTNLATYITYKNYFCAVCNYDTRNISIWNIALHFDDRDEAERFSNVSDDDLPDNLYFDDDIRSWYIKDSNSVYKIKKIKYTLPTYLMKVVKKCYPYMISQCYSLDSHPYDLQLKCLAYYAPIELKTESGLRKFRNIHCALCNNVNVTDTGDKRCKFDINTKKKPSFSFALLLDINQSDGSLVGKKKLCEQDEAWDPFFKKCRSLVCALPGHVVKEGKCAPS